MKIVVYNTVIIAYGKNRFSSLHLKFNKVGQLESQGEEEEEESLVCQQESLGKTENCVCVGGGYLIVQRNTSLRFS